MKCIMSDDGRWVVVSHKGSDEPEEYTYEEFVEAYGEESLPTIKVKPRNDSKDIFEAEIIEYYESLRDLTRACGKYNWAIKLEANVKDGTNWRAEKVALNTYGPGYETILPKEIERLKGRRHLKALWFDKKSRKIGYLPMSDRDIDILLRCMDHHSFRKALYYRIDRNSRKLKLASIKALIEEIVAALKKSSSK